MNRQLFLTRPVNSAYALVKVPELRGVRTYVNNNPVGWTNHRGDLLVTGLLPYGANRISIDDADIPLDHEFGTTVSVVAPPTRGGVVVRFPVTRTQIVRGRLTPGQANAAFGEVVLNVHGVPLRSPIGSEGNFEFMNLSPGDWEGVARYPGGSCRITLHVPDVNAPIQDLGTLSCDGSHNEDPQ